MTFREFYKTSKKAFVSAVFLPGMDGEILGMGQNNLPLCTPRIHTKTIIFDKQQQQTISSDSASEPFYFINNYYTKLEC